MGDMKDKAKSFLKKFSSPFGSSRKFKGHGHRLGAHSQNEAPTPSSSSSAAPAAASQLSSGGSSSSRGAADSRQWMRQENEQNLQQGDWRKLQQEKWAKERKIPIHIPNERVVSSNRRAVSSVSNTGTATHFSNEKQAAAPVSAALPQEDGSETDRLVSAVEAKEELATALGTFLSAEPSSVSLDVLLRLLRNIVKEPKLEKFRKLRMGNPKIKETIGTAIGANELLECLGFNFVGEGEELWAVMDEPVGETVTVLKGVIALMESQLADLSEPVSLPPMGGSSTLDAVTPAVDRQFVESTLADVGLQCELFHPFATRNNVIPHLPLLNGKCPTLEEADLVPTALLKFKPLQGETADYHGLHPECIDKCEPLTAVPF